MYTITAQYALSLVDVVVEQGCSREAIMAAVNFEETEIGTRIGVKDFANLSNQAVEMTGDPALGLKLGQRLNWGAYGALGQAMLNSPSLREATGLITEYMGLLGMSVPWKIHRAEGRCFIGAGDQKGVTDKRFLFEVLCASLYAIITTLLQRQSLSFRIEFPYQKPGYAQQYDAMFGQDLRYDCPVGRISYPLSLESVVLKTHNPTLFSLYRNECERLLSIATGSSITRKVLQRLRQTEDSFPSSVEMAAALNINVRTLRLQLKHENATYRELLNKARAERATYLLKYTGEPMPKIARAVGFESVSSFLSAYRRWTGEATTAVRGIQPRGSSAIRPL